MVLGRITSHSVYGNRCSLGMIKTQIARIGGLIVCASFQYHRGCLLPPMHAVRLSPKIVTNAATIVAPDFVST
jgi:hypothetical protein